MSQSCLASSLARLPSVLLQHGVPMSIIKPMKYTELLNYISVLLNICSDPEGKDYTFTVCLDQCQAYKHAVSICVKE